MEHLNKTQLILLALLVSFVSSIATGIVTVTLMQQAPPGVTQTINRVVEKTIEKVIPVRGPTPSETRIVKEEDLVIAAIDANAKSVVKITVGADSTNGISGEEVGSGVVLSSDGYIVTDSGSVAAVETIYYAETSDRQILQLSRAADRKGFTLFKVIVKEKSPAVTLTPAAFADSNQAKVGQSVISLGDSVARGIITSFSYDVPASSSGTTTPSAAKILSLIHTSTNAKDTQGSAVVNLDGNIIGIVGPKGTIPSNIIREALTDAQKKA